MFLKIELTWYDNIQNVCAKKERQKVNFNDLSKFIYQKYGLKFTPAIPGSTKLYVLKSAVDNGYFAMMSRIKQGNHYIATLDLRCGDFAETIRDLPGFTAPFRLRSNDWVGIWLDRVDRDTIENAFDYAFRLAMNGDTQKAINQQPFIYVAGDKTDKQYQAQAIKPRQEVLKKRQQIIAPKPIQKMLESYDYSILPAKGRAKNFYHQGQMMADYDDDYQDTAVFKRYYPTYHDMNIRELRTYFTWRTKIRQGKYEKTSMSYAFVYVYELLNNIGVANPQVGFEKLIAFEKNYAEKYDLEIKSYLDKWLKDYVLYYHLTQEREVAFAKELTADKRYHILLHPKKYQAQEITQVFQDLSTYLPKCLAYKKLGKKYDELLKEIWLAILKIKKQNGQSFFHEYIATRTLLSQNLFAGAVFYWQHQHQENNAFAVDSERKYFYQNQEWYCSSLYPIKNQCSNLNTFLHEIDRLLRIAFHLGRPLKARKIEKEYLTAIKQGITKFQEQEEEAKRPKVHINFADLSQIRADASITRESLLTDEEKELEADEKYKGKATVPEKDSKREKTASAQEILPKLKNDYDLNQDEQFLLFALLEKKPWKNYVKKHHLMLSILADGINDKLFDEIGDAVIEFDQNDQPKLIEDYIPDLKEIFLRRDK